MTISISRVVWGHMANQKSTRLVFLIENTRLIMGASEHPLDSTGTEQNCVASTMHTQRLAELRVTLWESNVITLFC